MLDLSTQLKYYKREDIRSAIVSCAQDREVSVRIKSHFGKRPDMLKYPTDVLEFAKKGASSFHCSEERWHHVLKLNPTLKKSELDENRKAWDLVLDIDCPYWELSKIITYLFIESLQSHGIETVSVKFSGNKGFHVGVPFEAFPKEWQDKPLSSLFPQAPRAIALYLLESISKDHIQVSGNQITFGKRKENQRAFTINELSAITQKPIEKLAKRLCTSCNREVKMTQAKQEFDFLCGKCGFQDIGSDVLEDFRQCAKCNAIMEKKVRTAKQEGCSCGNKSSYLLFDPKSIVEVDTILLASRHLYRMPYSLHESSGLVSVPIDISEVLSFDKRRADPSTFQVNSNVMFLDIESAKQDEGKVLLEKAFSFLEEQEQKKVLQEEAEKQLEKKEFSRPESALPEELFPPCIKLILEGIKDGKKRAVFILINFLRSVGWEYDQIEELLKKWNEKNTDPLREVVWKGQLRYHKMHKKDVLPPNCASEQYYVDIGVCKSDNLCSKIKNPVNYTRRKAFFLRKDGKKSGEKKKVDGKIY